ncbi:MAG: signal peptidase II [Acholeplasmatales bacterium]|nr:signal peptidase II [Acholeplasmatales bacterium]
MVVTVILFFCLVMADQVLKFVVERVALNDTLVLIPNFLELRLTYNPGMAWGALGNNTLLLTIISAVATIILCYFATKNDWKRNKVGAIALTMALAGCVGNLFDRMITVFGWRDGVVDMIILKPFDWLCELLHLGTTIFNLADVFLVLGIIIFAIDFCFFADRKKKKYDNKNREGIRKSEN